MVRWGLIHLVFLISCGTQLVRLFKRLWDSIAWVSRDFGTKSLGCTGLVDTVKSIGVSRSSRESLGDWSSHK